MRRPEVRRTVGVYRRRVVDEHGAELVIPIPRFICRRRGGKKCRSTTFSVLPPEVAPRRKWSLRLVARVVKLSAVAALEQLSFIGVVAEARQLRRWIELLARACERLRMHAVAGVEVALSGGIRPRALELVRAFGDSDPPHGIVMAFQQRWGCPLLDIRMS